MVIVLSFLFFIILFLTFGLIFSKIKINVKKLDFKMFRNELFEKDYLIDIGIYLFGKIRILGITFRDNNMKFVGRNLKLDNIKKSKLYKNLEQSDIKEIDKKVLIDNIKNLNLKFEKFNLDLSLGTDSTLITSFLIFVVSTVISLIVQKGVSKYNPKKHSFIITPRYENCNLVNMDLKCILAVKTKNIVKILKYISESYKTNANTNEDTIINKNKHYPGYV